MTTNHDRAQIEALGESMAMSKREAALQARIEELKGTISDLKCDVAYWKENASKAVAAERNACALITRRADGKPCACGHCEERILARGHG